MVGSAGAVGRGDDVRVGDEGWHGGDDGVVLPACSAFVFLQQFAYEQGCGCGREVEFGEQSVVDEFHLCRPVGLGVVAAPLVYEYAADDACLLCLLGAVHQSAERVVVVLRAEALQPVGRGGYVVGGFVFVEEFNLASSHCHVDDAHLDAVGQVCHERASEVVGRCQSRVVAA